MTMRGLVEQTESGTIYLGVKHGVICQESKKEREGFTPIEVTNPETREVIIKFIKPYNSVEALVTKIEWKEHEWDGRTYRSWRIGLNAAGTPCVLEIPFESRVSSRFMKLAENLKFTEPIEFRAWLDESGNTAFVVRQNGVSVPQKYTRENPGECPEPVKRVTGKWNFDDQVEFLYDRMLHVVIPRVEAAQEIAKGNGEPSHDEPWEDGERENIDEGTEDF